MRTKQFYLGVLLLLSAGICLSQDYNPYKGIGKKGRIVTLSNGRYDEVFDTDSIQRVGTVLINIYTKQVVKFLDAEEVYKKSSNNTSASRWYSVDPLADKFTSYSPYNFVENNPINKVDPDGRESQSTHTDKNGKVLKVIDDGDLGIYKHDDAKTASDIKWSKDNTSAGGELMGRSLTINSFSDAEYGGAAGKINFGSTEARDWQYKSMRILMSSNETGMMRLLDYALNAGSYERFDFKTLNMMDANGNINVPEGYDNANDYMFRGSQIAPGVYAPARDVGNYFAGRVAANSGIDQKTFLIVAGMFELSGNNLTYMREHAPTLYQKAASSWPTYGEKPMSNFMQRAGYQGLNTPEKLAAIGTAFWIP